MRNLASLTLLICISTNLGFAQEVIFAGKWWRSLHSSSRKAYVWGFMMAYESAYDAGCQASIKDIRAAIVAERSSVQQVGCDAKLRVTQDDVLIHDLNEFYRNIQLTRI